MAEILKNTGAKLWSMVDDHDELQSNVFDQLFGTGGKSDIRLIDEAIGKINEKLDGYYFKVINDRLYICKDTESGITSLPVSIIDDNGHTALKVDGTSITIDGNGVVHGATIDDAFSLTSENAVQNKVVKAKFDEVDGKINANETTISSHKNDKNNPHSVTKEQVGLGNVEDKSSETIRGEITKDNVTTALGYTPYTPNEVDNKFSTLETNIDWKEAVDTFDDIATTYPNPEDGWTVNTKDNNITYRYNGSEWVAISANAIPKATNSVDGLLSKEDHAKYDDAVSNAHTHDNKTVLDGITSDKVSAWDNKSDFSGNYNDLSDKPMIPKGDGITITMDEDGTLHGVAKITVDTALSSTSTNPVQNKVVTSNLTDLRKGAVTNLLNPTLRTATQNGVTCTNNGDGTYTLNGTATSEAVFEFIAGERRKTLYKSVVGKTLKFLDGGFGTSNIGRLLLNIKGDDGNWWTKGEQYNGYVFTVLDGYSEIYVDLRIKKGSTLQNVLLKPMLTTNLNATYDDFVPYTGDTGRLNGDVAELQDSKADKTEVPKLVKVDGKTVFLSEDGVLSAKGGGATITPKPTVNPQIKNDDKKVVITWENPTDTVIEGSTFSKWAGTKLVMKESGYPTSPDDGILLVDNTTRNKYKTTGFTKSGLTNDKVYYFALFPYSTDGVYNYDSGNRLLGEPTELKIVTFANGTDAEIAKMIQAHYANKINISDYWAVGDTRSVALSAMSATGVGESHRAQTVQFVIGDFEHDDLATAINGHTKAAITLLQKDCLMDASNASNPVNGRGNTENGYMNSSNTNSGGWKSCARRTWCNNVFFAALPSAWQSMVKTVNKKVSVGNNQSTIETVQDKIFLAAEIEIFGSTTYSVSGEGTQYQYYKNTTANRYKMPKWDSSYVSNIYLERSPNSGDTAYFCRVSYSGYANYGSANNANGVAPCLCI